MVSGEGIVLPFVRTREGLWIRRYHIGAFVGPSELYQDVQNLKQGSGDKSHAAAIARDLGLNKIPSCSGHGA